RGLCAGLFRAPPCRDADAGDVDQGWPDANPGRRAAGQDPADRQSRSLDFDGRAAPLHIIVPSPLVGEGCSGGRSAFDWVRVLSAHSIERKLLAEATPHPTVVWSTSEHALSHNKGRGHNNWRRRKRRLVSQVRGHEERPLKATPDRAARG